MYSHTELTDALAAVELPFAASKLPASQVTSVALASKVMAEDAFPPAAAR